MTVIFDSSAWIEYFAGSKKGKKVKEFLDKNENVHTLSVCLMEIKNKYIREGHEFENQINFICSISSIIDINREIALKGAEIKQKYKLYTVDALIYSASQLQKATLLTGDHHFKDLKNVKML